MTLDYSEIFDPCDVNIYTYCKVKTYIRSQNGGEGFIDKYVVDKQKLFYYGVKWVKELDN